MKKRVLWISMIMALSGVFGLAVAWAETPGMLPAGAVIYQDFETNSDVWAWNGKVEFSAEKVHGGNKALKLGGTALWPGCGIQAKDGTWDFDLSPKGKNTQITLWVWADPDDGNPHNIAIQFNDTKKNKVDVWTQDDPSGQYEPGQWTLITVPIPEKGIDIHHIDKLCFQSYNPGTYYIDDIVAGP